MREQHVRPPASPPHYPWASIAISFSSPTPPSPSHSCDRSSSNGLTEKRPGWSSLALPTGTRLEFRCLGLQLVYMVVSVEGSRLSGPHMLNVATETSEHDLLAWARLCRGRRTSVTCIVTMQRCPSEVRNFACCSPKLAAVGHLPWYTVGHRDSQRKERWDNEVPIVRISRSRMLLSRWSSLASSCLRPPSASTRPIPPGWNPT